MLAVAALSVATAWAGSDASGAARVPPNATMTRTLPCAVAACMSRGGTTPTGAVSARPASIRIASTMTATFTRRSPCANGRA